MSGPGTRRRKLGIWAGGTLAVLFAAWAAAELWSRNMLERELAESRRLGTLDLAPLLPSVPRPEDNGIWEIQRAGQILSKRPRGSFLPGGPKVWQAWEGDPWKIPGEALEAVKAAAAGDAELVSLVRRAADRPGIRYDLRPQLQESLAAMRLPHLHELRTCAQYLGLQARLAQADGRTDAALQDLARAARIGRSLEDEPVTVSVLVDMAVLNMACDGVDAVLAPGAPAAPAALEGLSKALVVPPGLARRAYLGERAFGVDIFTRLTQGGNVLAEIGEDPKGWVPAGISSPWFRWEEACYLRYLNRAIAAGEVGPFPSQASIPRRSYICRMLLPAIEKVAENIRIARARCDATRWGLAVLGHRARTGKLPESLDSIPAELLPDRPLDPFGGNPFDYAQDGASFSVSSKGKGPGGKPLGISWKVSP